MGYVKKAALAAFLFSLGFVGALRAGVWGARLARGVRAAMALLCAAMASPAAADCRFGPPRGSPQLVFPALRSDSASLVLSRPLDIPFECSGGAVPDFKVTGAHDAGPGTQRMRHESRDSYLSYTIRIDVTRVGPTSVLRLTGEVAPASVEEALAGAYADTITVTVTP